MKIVKGVVSLVLVAMIVAVAFGNQPKDGKKKTEEIATVRLIKQDFVALTGRMLKVADLIEKTEPDSAKAIRLAVSKAQAAFIAEDMEKVAELLRGGMMIAAVGRGEEVSRQLKEMLRILEQAADPDRDKDIERAKQALAAIQRLLKEERKLEADTRMSNQGEKVGQLWASLAKELADITKAQEGLLAKAKDLPVDPAVGNLNDLREKVRKLIREQENINEATDKSPIDKLPVVGEVQKSSAAKADALSKTLASAAKGSKSAAALSKASKSASQASGEMDKASRELMRANTPKARPAQAQAVADLKSAAQALSRAIEKAS